MENLKFTDITDLTVTAEVKIQPTTGILNCAESVGGLDGTEYNIDKPLKRLCKMCKQI